MVMFEEVMGVGPSAWNPQEIQFTYTPMPHDVYHEPEPTAGSGGPSQFLPPMEEVGFGTSAPNMVEVALLEAAARSKAEAEAAIQRQNALNIISMLEAEQKRAGGLEAQIAALQGQIGAGPGPGSGPGPGRRRILPRFAPGMGFAPMGFAPGMGFLPRAGVRRGGGYRRRRRR